MGFSGSQPPGMWKSLGLTNCTSSLLLKWKITLEVEMTEEKNLLNDCQENTNKHLNEIRKPIQEVNVAWMVDTIQVVDSIQEGLVCSIVDVSFYC